MLRFIAGRLIVVLSVGLTLSIVTFFLLNYVIDPAQAIAGEDALFEEIEQIREQYGFDRSITVRYFEWFTGIFQGDLGESYYWNKPVISLLVDRAPETITLALMSVSVTILISIPLGIMAALNPNSLIDRIALGIAVTAQAVPNFWLGLIMILIFALAFPIFPVSGDKTLFHFVLPSIVLGASSVPAVMRLMRTGLLDVINADYIRTARSSGFYGWRLIFNHALRNALLPVVSVLAVQLGNKFGGSVITESVFAINGLGRLALESILGADIPTVQILVFVFAIIFLFFNLLADILNAYLDPRLRL
jgi:peptide/nickel transport system permease protein|tara:strand:- start:1450 stop:2364 length:915 start_codon:yes stop_codon:yes gene_type:complete